MSDELEPELERVAQMLRNAGPLPDAPATLRDRALAAPDADAAPVADLAAARRRRRPRTGVLLGIAAVVAALVIVPAVILTRDDGGSTSIALSPRTFAPNGGGSAEVVSHADGTATISLTVWKMPRPGTGRAYEAWLGREGDRRALGQFQVSAEGRATISYEVPQGELDDYRWLWVTSEPAGSVTTPSDKTALWGPLT